jgi:hypothetical protein
MAGLTSLLGGGAALGGPGFFGLLGGGALGLGGSLFNVNQQRHASDFARSEGDPYRSLLRQYTMDPSSYFKGPLAQELARQADTRYSSVFGNPAGSGTAQALTLQAMLNGYGSERDRLAKMGGLEDINANMAPSRNAQNRANMGVFGSLMDLLGMGSTFLGGGGGGGPEQLSGPGFQ